MKVRSCFITLILAVFALAAPAFCATSTEIPNGQVIEKSKPFIGNWAAVICTDEPVGISFTIALKPNTDKSVSPVFTATAQQGDVTHANPVEYNTVSFADVTNSDGTKFVGLAVEKGDYLIRIRPSMPNARKSFVTDLDMIIEDVRGGEVALGFAIKPGDDPKDPWMYVKTLALACPPPEDNQVKNPGIQTVAFADRGETDGEINAAREEFSRFAAEHSDKIDVSVLGREAVGKPWFARYYEFLSDDKPPITWEEEGYSRLLNAVVAIEKAFLTHPEGYSGKSSEGERQSL